MRAVLAALLMALASPALAAPTDAANYDTFFLWAGVKPQPVLEAAHSLYLLQGQVSDGDPVRLVSQRPALPKVSEAAVWMVVRVETLDWPDTVYQQVLSALDRWRAAGNKVVGLQIDFDAGTRHLENYAVFLADLKKRLPADYRLARLEQPWRSGRSRGLGRRGR
jgi:CHASE2 domain-containing sensor protein